MTQDRSTGEESKGLRQMVRRMPWKRIGMTLGAAVIVAALIIFVPPVMVTPSGVRECHGATETYYETEPYETSGAYIEKEPYVTTEAYSAQEPYVVAETYYETQPYSGTASIDYMVTGKGMGNWYLGTGSDCWITIKNADIWSGYFYVAFNLVTARGTRTTHFASDYLPAGQEKQIRTSLSGDYVASFTYSITPPIKQVTINQQLAKTRPTVEYRSVEKTRPAIAYRDVTKSKPTVEYHDVEKTREVVRYRDAETTRRTTIFGYLTGW